MDAYKPVSKKQINDLAKNVLRQLTVLKNDDKQSTGSCCPGPCCPDPMGHFLQNKVQRSALALQYDLANVKTDGTAEDLVGGLWPTNSTPQNTALSLKKSHRDISSYKTSRGHLAKQKLDEHCGPKTDIDSYFEAIEYPQEKPVYEEQSGRTQALIKILLKDMPVPPSSGAFDGLHQNKSKNEVS